MTVSSRFPAILKSVMHGQPRALADSHYPAWHHAPVTGLLNDPNGFTEFAGRYHLFYQWNPIACDHKFKCWGHWSSADLLHWQHEPLALIPEESYDRSGCYSGSAVDDNGVLTLCYTGNVKFEDGGRTAWQCLATENDDGTFSKEGPVLALPQGYTGHVRDPKVWQHQGRWYMVLGAQNLDEKGKVLLFSSADLRQWQFQGEIAGFDINGDLNAGYMWECPDLFPLDSQHVLICCPQGIPAEEKRFLNTHCAVWLTGNFDYQTGIFQHGEKHELDAGFEFYAPQTMQASDGRRLLVGWMGVPGGEEMAQPTLQHGWIHQMTCLRELSLRQGKLYQQPLRELQALRGTAQGWKGDALPLEPMELSFATSGTHPRTLRFGDGLILQQDANGLRLTRPSLVCGEEQHRYWTGPVTHLQILVDRSSVEIFINQGEGVMSSRYFPSYPGEITFEGGQPDAFCYWLLERCVVE